jgi:hypothetical protein
MAFDQSTRGRLQKLVNSCRSLLSDEFSIQLQQTYGLDPKTGEVTPMARLTHLDDRQRHTAEVLRQTLAHYLGADADDTDHRIAVLDRMVREQAFSVLNRLAALLMMEARGQLIESVSLGYQSRGYQLYSKIAGTALGETGQAYQVYLFSVFDELAQELPALFDRYAANGLLFPRETALRALLDELNHFEIEHLWAADETIGWIYQYFNSKEERKAMRDASQAPRNSRELAVRNQFFTPRYVVEFLVDNTLGRLWYIATSGQTILRDRCQYLLIKPDEQQQAAIKLRDPRTLKLLDPACGSMHFGLYAFDLFAEIYREAWAWEQHHGPGSLDVSTQPQAALKPLCQTYEDEADFARDVPRLIIEHNIYGVDIDPRAAQIATLALWLRAQRAWHDAGVKAKDRPSTAQGHVVAAVAPPAEKELHLQFATNLDQRDAELFEKTVLMLEGLPELGMLLKVDRELPKLIRQVYVGKGTDLFAAQEQERWQQAEARLRAALTEFAKAVNSTYQGRLFAQDALDGLRLIDLSSETFDVVVMNPPFGESSAATKPYLKEFYGDNAVELYCAFAVRALELLRPSGLLGCITSSSFVLYTDFASYRELLLKEQRLDQLVNLGDSVLDGAYVYTASYVVQKAPPSSLIAFYDLRYEKEKEKALKDLVSNASGQHLRFLPPEKFSVLASSPLCHWASDSLFSLVESSPPLAHFIKDAGVGAAPQADFFNLWWEVPLHKIGLKNKWVRIANGGAFSPYHRPDYLVVDWENNGRRAIADLNNRYPYLNGNVGIRIQRTHLFGSPGITYGKRTDRFNAQVLPADQIFTFEGIGVFPALDDSDYLLGFLAYLNSRFVAYYLNLTAGLHKNDVYVKRLPFPIAEHDVISLGKSVREILPLVIKAQSVEEVHPLFSGTFLGQRQASSISQIALTFKNSDRIDESKYLDAISELDKLVNKHCGLDDALLKEVEHDQGYDVGSFHQSEKYSQRTIQSPERERAGFCRSEFEKASDLYRYCIDNQISPTEAAEALNRKGHLEAETLEWFANSIISYALGTSFGRWDIDYVTEKKFVSGFPDLLSALPSCSPGMLKNEHGLPISHDEIPYSYPIQIPHSGILVDDKSNKWDIEICVRAVIEIIWESHSEAIESDLCEVLGVKTLRDYLAKSGGFFSDHLGRYSRSRRKAPIYWPLSTVSGSYTLWVYYPSLNNQTLFTAVNDFLDGPNGKLTQVSRECAELRMKGSSRSRDEEKQYDSLQTFEQELTDLRDTLLKIAPTYQPNHDDGVQITAAPLWPLFRHKPWQKVLKDTWAKLEKGDYDWAHLAMACWPGRVREKSKTDKSLAIAHGLEDLYVEPEAAPKKTRGKKKARADE